MKPVRELLETAGRHIDENGHDFMRGLSELGEGLSDVKGEVDELRKLIGDHHGPKEVPRWEDGWYVAAERAEHRIVLRASPTGAPIQGPARNHDRYRPYIHGLGEGEIPRHHLRLGHDYEFTFQLDLGADAFSWLKYLSRDNTGLARDGWLIIFQLHALADDDDEDRGPNLSIRLVKAPDRSMPRIQVLHRGSHDLRNTIAETRLVIGEYELNEEIVSKPIDFRIAVTLNDVGVDSGRSLVLINGTRVIDVVDTRNWKATESVHPDGELRPSKGPSCCAYASGRFWPPLEVPLVWRDIQHRWRATRRGS
jgi:hypothetical protein